MTWIDTHCHLNHESFKHDLSDVIARANQDGVGRFIVSAVTAWQWVEQLCLSTENDCIYNTFSIHPWYCTQHQEKHLQQLEELIPDLVGIGECGLDLMPNRPALEAQMPWFLRQVELAVKYDKPLVIHSVKASDIILKELKRFPAARGVVHGFSGSMQQAKAYIDQGFHIGIGTRMVRTDSAKTESLMKELPLESILLETDAPNGLGQSSRNEPKGIILVANVLAKLRNQPVQDILATCTKNAEELFKL